MRDHMELYKQLETFIPNHKLGFKILEDDQLKNVFPTYELLLEKIEYHREKLKEHGTIRGIDNQYNLMYDNVYSIMGERGSGKTSALFTLKKKIEQNNPKDWVLPVIMPEMIPENAEIIGWILAILGDVVDKIEKKLETNLEMKHDSGYFRDCKFRANNDLRQAYEKVKQLHFSKNSTAYHSNSLAQVADSNEMQTFNSFDFGKAFSKFWDVLIDAISKSESANEGETPLIYIMFDDVDLTPYRIMEILSTIIRYLAHPNLIVIITAEEGLFYKVVLNQLCAKMDQGNMDAEVMEKTAELYVDKVIPPSSRFYLEMFDDCEKKRSFMQKVETREGEPSSESLEKFLRQQINHYIKVRVPKKRYADYESFLYYEKKQTQFLQTYLLFWGNTSRQLVNESLIVSNLIDGLKNSFEKVQMFEPQPEESKREKKQQYAEEVYKHVHGFIKSSIVSNRNLRTMFEDVEQFVNEICNRNKTRWPIYINYEALENFCFEKQAYNFSEEEQTNFIKNIVSLFVLLFFVENLLLVGDGTNDEWRISKERRYIHGAKHLVAILDSLLPDTLSLVRDNRNNQAVEQLMFHYSHILCRPTWLCKFNVYNYSDAKEYMYPLYSRKETSGITAKDLYKWHLENPRWFNTMTKLVFLMSTGMYALNKRNANDFLWGKNIKIYDPYISTMQQLEKEEFKRQLADSYMYANRKRTQISYNTYSVLLHRTKMIEWLQKGLEKNSGMYGLKEIKQTMLGFLEQDEFVQGEKKKNREETTERILRKVAFVHVVDKAVWGHELYSKDVIKNEIQRVQNSLIQHYSSADLYYVYDPANTIEQLQTLSDLGVTVEIKKIADHLLEEIQQGKPWRIVVVEHLIALLEKYIAQTEDSLWNDNVSIKNIKEYLLDEIYLFFKSGANMFPEIEIIMQHEALLYLQELYLEVLLDEMRELLRVQGVVETSFYQKYLVAMSEVLERGQYEQDVLLKGESSGYKMYLAKYFKGIIEETVDEYLDECGILPMRENGEVSNE